MLLPGGSVICGLVNYGHGSYAVPGIVLEEGTDTLTLGLDAAFGNTSLYEGFLDSFGTTAGGAFVEGQGAILGSVTVNLNSSVAVLLEGVGSHGDVRLLVSLDSGGTEVEEYIADVVEVFDNLLYNRRTTVAGVELSLEVGEFGLKAGVFAPQDSSSPRRALIWALRASTSAWSNGVTTTKL